MNKFWKDNYNIAAVTCGITTVILIIFFLKAGKEDVNYIYYLISVSAIYATIQLGYLLQKALSIRQNKTNLLTNFNDLWESVLHYRYLCALADNYLRQYDLHRYQSAKSLAVSRKELIIYKFTGDAKDISSEHLKELKSKMKEKSYDLGYALMIKQILFFSGDVYTHLNYVNRVYANNNETINAYIKGMLEDPVFSLMLEERDLPEISTLTDQIERHQFYKAFKIKAGLNKSSILDNLLDIERYVLNQVLFKLHDHTFLIEQPLPKAFKHLMVNSFTILTCGTILPLFNAFFAGSKGFTLICGALTIGSLLLSMTYIALTFREENNESVFKLVPVVYEGKEDINK